MGEYKGRRRGRPAADEPPPSVETPEYQDGYFAQESYGYEYEFGQPPSYNPAEYGYQAPSYENYTYEQDPAYGYASYQEAPSYGGYPEQGYVEQYEYAEQYPEQYPEQYADSYAGDYTDEYVEDYAEPQFQPRRRSASPTYEPDPSDTYEPAYEPQPRPQRIREALPLTSHLPFIAASTAALAVASSVSVKAVAAAVLPLQLLVAWAILDLSGHASRRTAALTALPALAGTVGTFKFAADEAATAVAAGVGAGFFLIAAEAVFRAGRRGVEPGATQKIAAAASALLFAGLTGMFLPAARLDLTAVAIGAAAGALLALTAARSPELGSSRVVIAALPASAAALASYAAAILMT